MNRGLRTRASVRILIVVAALVPMSEFAVPNSSAVAGSNCNSSRIDSRMKKVTYQRPADRETKTTLGPISITTINPVTMTDTENGTYLRFVLANSSDGPVTVRVPDVPTLESARPPWSLHMSVIRDSVLAADGSFDLIVPARGSSTVNVYVSNDAPPGQASANWAITFRLLESGSQVTIPVELRSNVGTYGPDGLRLPASAAISGTVRGPNGKPVANAEVTAFLTSGELRRYARTNKSGKFSISLVSDTGLITLNAGRMTNPVASWNLTVESSGNRLWYSGPINFRQGESRSCTINLSAIAARNYRLSSTINSSNGYGFWDIAFFGQGDRFVAAPGIHGPDNAIAPIAIRAYDLSGRELWNVPIDSVRDYGVWQIRVSRDGRFIAATSNDGFLRVISENGVVLHQRRVFNRQNSAAAMAFSPDGTLLATSTDDGLMVLDTATWATRWQDSVDAYRAIWSDTEVGLVTASLDGIVTSYSTSGIVRWRRGAGYATLFLHVDSVGRTTTAGKSRVARSWDSNGNSLWSQPVAHTANRTAADRGGSTSGDMIVIPTFNGLDQAFDAAGKALWSRWLPVLQQPNPSGGTMLRVPGPGHAGTFVSSDGSLVAQCTRGNQVIVLSHDGSKLWQSQEFPTKSGYPDGGHYNPGCNSVALSSDGRFLVAGFADAVIRIFSLS